MYRPDHPTTPQATLALTYEIEGDTKDPGGIVHSAVSAATLTVSPGWMGHGYRFVRGLKQIHKQQPSQLFPRECRRTGRTADL